VGRARRPLRPCAELRAGSVQHVPRLPSPAHDAPLALLLLPVALEQFEHAEHARDLLRAPRVLALEPPRVSWRRIGRLPSALALGVGVRQAKRLKLPGSVRVVVLYDPLQLPLAHGLLLRNRSAQLWRARQVAEAQATAAFAFDPGASNDPLWDRLEELGVAEFVG
jgi:hypothetical protein